MSDVALVLRQSGYALRGTSRNARAVVFTLLFPVVLLVLFNAIFASGSNATTRFTAGRIDTDAYFTAGIAAYAITMSAFSTLAIALTTERESGQLKRLRGTPMPAWTFIAAQVLRAIVLSLLMVVVLIAIGSLAFGVDVRGGTLVGLVVYVVLGTATMAACGIALTVVTPSAEAASAIAPFSAVILSFISGVFIPVEQLPGWLEEIGRVFPLAHLAEGLQTCFAPGISGTGLSGGNVGVLGVWLAAAVLVAARGFRWEPQSRGG